MISALLWLEQTSLCQIVVIDTITALQYCHFQFNHNSLTATRRNTPPSFLSKPSSKSPRASPSLRCRNPWMRFISSMIPELLQDTIPFIWLDSSICIIIFPFIITIPTMFISPFKVIRKSFLCCPVEFSCSWLSLGIHYIKPVIS